MSSLLLAKQNSRPQLTQISPDILQNNDSIYANFYSAMRLLRSHNNTRSLALFRQILLREPRDVRRIRERDLNIFVTAHFFLATHGTDLEYHIARIFEYGNVFDNTDWRFRAFYLLARTPTSFFDPTFEQQGFEEEVYFGAEMRRMSALIEALHLARETASVHRQADVLLRIGEAGGESALSHLRQALQIAQRYQFDDLLGHIHFRIYEQTGMGYHLSLAWYYGQRLDDRVLRRRCGILTALHTQQMNVQNSEELLAFTEEWDRFARTMAHGLYLEQQGHYEDALALYLALQITDAHRLLERERAVMRVRAEMNTRLLPSLRNGMHGVPPMFVPTVSFVRYFGSHLGK